MFEYLELKRDVEMLNIVKDRLDTELGRMKSANVSAINIQAIIASLEIDRPKYNHCGGIHQITEVRQYYNDALDALKILQSKISKKEYDNMFKMQSECGAALGKRADDICDESVYIKNARERCADLGMMAQPRSIPMKLTSTCRCGRTMTALGYKTIHCSKHGTCRERVFHCPRGNKEAVLEKFCGKDSCHRDPCGSMGQAFKDLKITGGGVLMFSELKSKLERSEHELEKAMKRNSDATVVIEVIESENSDLRSAVDEYEDGIEAYLKEKAVEFLKWQASFRGLLEGKACSLNPSGMISIKGIISDLRDYSDWQEELAPVIKKVEHLYSAIDDYVKEV